MLRQEDLGDGPPVRGSSGTSSASPGWPAGSPAAAFLSELLARMGELPRLGSLLRVPLPTTDKRLEFSPPRRALTRGGAGPLLHCDTSTVELEARHLKLSTTLLQVPPDLGLGPDNAGISAARLLFFLPPRVALTLIASLLLERRIILVSSGEDKVSAAVHAAAALLHPFRWQHIYLPLLPLSLKDYLAAPMPYLVGLNSECLPMLRTMPLEEVLLVDLDLGECTPPPDNPNDDAFSLPYASKLLSALETCKDGTLSSTEFNSTPFIASVMQEYFLKLVGKYRLYIQPDAAESATPRSDSRVKNGSKADDVLRAHGYAFDQAAFVAQRGTAEVREFLQQFRHSQMFEVFITERLRLAASDGGLAACQDGFEAKVTQLMSKQPMFGGGMMGMGPGQPSQLQTAGGRFSSMLKKTANAMRQSSEGLVKGLKHLGSTQEESYVAMPRRQTNNSFSSFSLQRVSPVAGLTPPSPVARSGTPGHSRVPSLSQAPRVPSFTRLSPSQVVLGSHHKVPHVSLEDVNPDLFFEGIAEDDAASEASCPGSAFGTRSGNSSPGPGEPSATRSKTFSNLFRLSSSQSAAPSPRASQQQLSSQGPLLRGSSSKSSPNLLTMDVRAGGPPGQAAQLPVSSPARQQQQQQPAGAVPGIAASGQPALADLLSGSPYPTTAPAAGSEPLLQASLLPGILEAQPAGTAQPHSWALDFSGGSGAFGSPVGQPGSRRPSNTPLDASASSSAGASPRIPFHSSNSSGMRATEGHHRLSHMALPQASSDSLTSAILGALQAGAPGAGLGPSRSSTTGSGSAGDSSEWAAFAAATMGQSKGTGTAGGSRSDQQPLLAGGSSGGPSTALQRSGASLGAADWSGLGLGGVPLRGTQGAQPGAGSRVQDAAGGSLSSKMAVKDDAFGGLLVNTVSHVAEDLAVRRRTSSQERAAGHAATSPAASALASGTASLPSADPVAAAVPVAEEPSWADFTGAAAAVELTGNMATTTCSEALLPKLQPQTQGQRQMGQQQSQPQHQNSWGDWLAPELGQKCAI
ncbi:hypothetical protein N2152v2_003772 [Parachlorella kessleri]